MIKICISLPLLRDEWVNLFSSLPHEEGVASIHEVEWEHIPPLPRSEVLDQVDEPMLLLTMKKSMSHL